MTVKAFVVEDNPAIRESLVETLAELVGITTVGEAASEKAAVAWLADTSNEWDIAVVDLVLERGGSGLGVLKAIQPRSPDRRVIVLTGTASSQMREECQALGSDAVFDKSMDTEAMLDFCLAFARDKADEKRTGDAPGA